MTSFGGDLFARLCQGNDDNVFISPLSVASALAMVATGTTAGSPAVGEFASVLHLDFQQDHDLDAWERASASLSDGGSVDLLQANSLWAHSAVLQEFKDKVQSNFGALVADLPANAKPINDWVSTATKGLVPKIVDDGVVSDPMTRAILVNAVYFKGRWNTPFSVDATHPGTFKALGKETPCQMMTHKRPVFVPYAVLPDGSTAVALPYSGKRFRSLIILPQPFSTDAASARSLATALASPDALDGVRRALGVRSEQRVRMLLPRFKMEFGVRDLKAELRAAGLGSAFDKDGQFLGVAQDPLLRLTQVLHKAVIEITEEGTEAAAATAAVMMTRSARMEPPPKDFVVDRPFVLVVEDTETGTPLFIGRVVAPSFTGLDAVAAGAI